MSSHPQPSPPGGMRPHHGALPNHPQVNGHMSIQPPQGQKALQGPISQQISQLNEGIWLQIGMYTPLTNVVAPSAIDEINPQFFTVPTGHLSELMGDYDGAIHAFEQALRHNQWSIPAMSAISCILRSREHFQKAIEYLQNIIKLDPQSGDSWGSLGRFPGRLCLYQPAH